MTRRVVPWVIVLVAAIVTVAWIVRRPRLVDEPAAPKAAQEIEAQRESDVPSNRVDRSPEAVRGETASESGMRERQEMVERQLRGRDIRDERVLQAMQTVPRHSFMPDGERPYAYADAPRPIGHGQTISQPYIVALMTQLVEPLPDAHVLDIGTGSGYQAAVLSLLADKVYSIEIICELADEARERLQRLGYDNVVVRCGDGYQGWPEHAPFDAIIVAAAPDHVPQPLIDQLAVGGRLVIPVGSEYQELVLIEKQPDGQVTRRTIAPVRFVPMTGEAER